MINLSRRVAELGLRLGSWFTIAACAISIPGYFRAAASAMDEGVLVLYPALARMGFDPYRDFRYLHGPAEVWVVGRLPDALLSARLLGVTSHVVVAYCAYLIVRRKAPDLALPAAAISLAFGLGATVNGSAWYFGLALLAVSITFAERGSLLLAGLFAGAAVTSRFDLALSALFVGVGRDRRDTSRFALGAVVPAIALVVQVFHSGLSDTWQSIVVDELRQASGRRLPIPHDIALLGLVLVLLAIARLAFTARRLHQWRLVAICLPLIATMLQRMDGGHIAYVGALVVPVALTTFRTVDRRIVVGLVAIAIIASPVRTIGAYGATALHLRDPDGEVVKFEGKRWIAEVGDGPAIDALLKTVAELPGCSLFVGPADLRFAEYNDSFLYWMLLDRFEPVGPFLELNPGIANREGSGWAEGLERADVVVLDSRLDPPSGARPKAGPDLRPLLLRTHREVAAPEPFEVFVRPATGSRC